MPLVRSTPAGADLIECVSVNLDLSVVPVRLYVSLMVEGTVSVRGTVDCCLRARV